MIAHIIKVSIRNLLKYRQQSIISIIGLAVGIVCFALSAYWIRYERGFDAFHKNADRIYQVRQIDPNHEYGIYINTPPPLAQTLEKYFPGIKASAVSQRVYDIEPEESKKEIDVEEVDKNFFELFDVQILLGSIDFNDERGILVSESFSKNYYHTDNPIGKELIQYVSGEEYKRFTVRGVIKDWPKNTNMPFQAICPIGKEEISNWSIPSINYILLDKETDARTFKEKLEKLPVKEMLSSPSFTIVPIKEAYYTEPTYNDAGLKFKQVALFALLGLLVIASALFNYLNLYVSRIWIRTKELSLRKVIGSSKFEIFILLSTEFLILLLVACSIGLIGIEWSLPKFKTFADIQSDTILIYRELAVYLFILIVISLCMVSVVIHYTQRRLFQESIRTVLHPRGKGIFSKISLLLQMIIGVGCIFCTTVYYKQIHTLGHANPGFDRSNILSFHTSPKNTFFYRPSAQEFELISSGLKSIPTVTQFMPIGYGAILPRTISSSSQARTEKMNDNECIEYNDFSVYPDYIKFYGLQLIAGKDFKTTPEENGADVIINQTLAQKLGLKDPVGQVIIEIPKAYYLPDGTSFQPQWSQKHTIIGVVKDFAYASLITPCPPIVLSVKNEFISTAVKYQPGTYKQTREAITQMVEKKIPGYESKIFNMDEEYRKQFASEESLRFLYALLTLVCVIISLFGIYSMIALDCEQYRKEIAIRKVNGASLLSIFYLLFKGYIQLLGIASVFAFTTGYLIIKPWTEHYVLQTKINWWLYPLLFLITTGIVFLTVFARIWHTAHINPAEELKKE
ncbi:ABC transporter permease [Parabacteroides sp. AM08-6]|uniref:ABC transporter permease n=1 Tax=Parabacteroides sp. AM08-6 TaxID=2292053 RepID=UPI000EFE991E|nr:ABC transporter permease [Parabacteroides sp. AM08-6]RHJ82355.1 ABC transporter permease [Parabacteroides sp. AM08-6]